MDDPFDLPPRQLKAVKSSEWQGATEPESLEASMCMCLYLYVERCVHVSIGIWRGLHEGASQELSTGPKTEICMAGEAPESAGAPFRVGATCATKD